jgi:hypothetical protein
MEKTVIVNSFYRLLYIRVCAYFRETNSLAWYVYQNE